MGRMWIAPGMLGLAALVGCGGHDHGPTPDGLISRAVVVADLAGQGRPDVASLARWASDGAGVVSLRYAQGGQGISFEAPVRIQVGRFPRDLVAVRLKESAPMSLLVVDEAQGASGVQIYTRSPQGTFAPTTRISLGTRIGRRLAAGDLDGDGLVDLAVAVEGESQVWVAIQRLDGTFAAPAPVAVDGAALAVAIGPVLPGGKNNLVVATDRHRVQILARGAQPGIDFTAAATFDTQVGPVALALADVNQDGLTDVLTANQYSGSISVWLQPPGPTYAATFATHYDTGDYSTVSLCVGELAPGTGMAVLAANAGLTGDSGSVSHFSPSPSQPGEFLPPILYRGYWGPSRVVLADLNRDGWQDMLVADGDPIIRLQDTRNPGWFMNPIWLLQ